MMMIPTQLLAVSDTAVISMWGVNVSLTVIIGVGLTLVFRGQDRNAKQVAELTTKVETADAKLHEASTKLIDERMRAITHSVNNHAQGLTSAMDRVAIRVATTESEIKSLGNVGPNAELKLLKVVQELQTFVRDCTPSRNEFTKVETSLEKLSDRVGELAAANVNREEMKSLLQEVLRK